MLNVNKYASQTLSMGYIRKAEHTQYFYIYSPDNNYVIYYHIAKTLTLRLYSDPNQWWKLTTLASQTKCMGYIIAVLKHIQYVYFHNPIQKLCDLLSQC